MFRYIVKIMYLEKLKRHIIWNEESISADASHQHGGEEQLFDRDFDDLFEASCRKIFMLNLITLI